MLLEKAIDIGNRLLPAFDSPTGIPYTMVNLATGDKSMAGWTGGAAILSEFTTLQLEFRKLSQLTGDDKYDKAVTRIMDLMEEKKQEDGLYPSYFSIYDGRWANEYVIFFNY